MPYNPRKLARPLRLLGLLAIALSLAGCTHLEEGTPISPSPVGQRPADFGLGPGIRPLSSGPGDKGSPNWSVSGERIAFVVDGYVVEKRINESEARRQTTRDFGAKRVTWTSSGRLAVLAEDSISDPRTASTSSEDPPQSVYSTSPDDSLSVDKLATRVSAMASTTEEDGLLVALREGSSASRLAIVRRNGAVQTYGEVIDGEVTALSVIPNGDRAIATVQKPGPERNFEILSFSFPENRFQTLASLRAGLRVFGTPQWTSNGIYYVAGEKPGARDEVSPDYNLYRLAPGSNRPELAPGVGEDFVASSLKRNPEGDLLAVIGRRNPSSPVNLYVLRPGVGNLLAATTNENMEIKTETEDLAWSGDGSRVAIVARTVLSEPRVYDVPVDALVSDFYNIYEAPIEETTGENSA